MYMRLGILFLGNVWMQLRKKSMHTCLLPQLGDWSADREPALSMDPTQRALFPGNTVQRPADSYLDLSNVTLRVVSILVTMETEH